MTRKLMPLILALALCLSLVPAPVFAVSAPKEAVIRELPVPGAFAYNYGGLGVIEDEQDNRYLVEWDGGILRSGRAWMEFDVASNIYMVQGEGYYDYPFGATLFTMEQMEASVKAFLQENFGAGEVVSVVTNSMNSFSGEYAANSFSAAIKDGDELIKYNFYALIDRNGLVHYMTPLMERTSGGGFPISYVLNEIQEGLIFFTKEYIDREGEWCLYERGYMDTDGNEKLVFSNNTGRDPNEEGVIVFKETDYTAADSFHNGVATVVNQDLQQSLIDRSGRLLMPFIHSSIYNNYGNYPVVYDEDKGWGYIDTAGVPVIPQEYDFASGNWDNIFVVEKGGKYGVVDTDNKPVVPFEYDSMSNPFMGTVYACKDGKSYSITFKDKEGAAPAPDDTMTEWGTKKVSARFTDVPAGIWYERYLQSACDNNIVGGTSDNTYTPGGHLTHAQIMVMVANLHKMAKNDKYDFQAHKVAGAHWAQPYRDYCKAEGIIDSRFDAKLDEDVTRAEMAYYFAHALPDDYYDDRAEVSLMDIATEEYGAEILKLAKSDIVTGYEVEGSPAREFRPGKPVTRAEAAVFVSNLLGAIGPTGGVY